MAETGQELQVRIIAREAASGWLQSSSYGELVIAAVISGHWTFRALRDRCTTGIGHSAELSQGNQGSVDPCTSKAVFMATNWWLYPIADLERCSEEALRA